MGETDTWSKDVVSKILDNRDHRTRKFVVVPVADLLDTYEEAESALAETQGDHAVCVAVMVCHRTATVMTAEEYFTRE